MFDILGNVLNAIVDNPGEVLDALGEIYDGVDRIYYIGNGHHMDDYTYEELTSLREKQSKAL